MIFYFLKKEEIYIIYIPSFFNALFLVPLLKNYDPNF
ncbi:hypothetical protein EDC18_101332 [Natranaerovirga pectinivora]|uniref:Uncharacterized protein n=1 Tax=Natranaerovirga pectinivora TaxID=682400 RepID=A0A4R3MUR0_9FIRM|nr:hypothetical protein EDC18_101332 [Natranaerovirga pectinivora]